MRASLVVSSALCAVLAAGAVGASERAEDRMYRKSEAYRSYEPSDSNYADEIDDGGYYDYARVVGVEPIVHVVQVSTPRRHCYEEEVVRSYGYQRRPHSYTPVVLGGILGGVVGNQFGGGTGNDLLTVGGALLGASLGYDHARAPRRQDYYPTREQRCTVSHNYHEEERVDGYRVTYVYNGKTYVRRMDRDPGRRIRVRVDVTPYG